MCSLRLWWNLNIIFGCFIALPCLKLPWSKWHRWKFQVKDQEEIIWLGHSFFIFVQNFSNFCWCLWRSCWHPPTHSLSHPLTLTQRHTHSHTHAFSISCEKRIDFTALHSLSLSPSKTYGHSLSLPLSFFLSFFLSLSLSLPPFMNLLSNLQTDRFQILFNKQTSSQTGKREKYLFSEKTDSTKWEQMWALCSPLSLAIFLLSPNYP